jgi:hypothetical protein
LIKNISIIGKVDNREKLNDFANRSNKTPIEVRARFIASGRIYCGGNLATANLVLKDDVLATNAHIFYKDSDTPKNCIPMRRQTKNCYFTPLLDEIHEGPRYEIDLESLQVGTMCPNNAERSKDWAVVRLKKHVMPLMVSGQKIDIAPYAIFNKSSFELSKRSVLQVGAAGNLNDSNQSFANICEGQIHDIFPQGGVNALYTDCSAKPGDSGSAYIVRDRNEKSGLIEDQFVGMVAMGSDPDHDYLPFSHDNFTWGPVVDSSFKNAILKAASK